MILNLKFQVREYEQKLADSNAKLEASKQEIKRLVKESPSLKVQRIEGPVRTEIVYEKVYFLTFIKNLVYKII